VLNECTIKVINRCINANKKLIALQL